jgi:transcriptional regulator with GAF, ATPase, and Fis domain
MPEGVPLSPTAEIARLVDEATKSGKGLGEEVLTKVVQEMAKLFSVKTDEIALLELSPEGTILSFLYPLKLRRIGTIPMTTTNSLAVRTARDKRPEMINNFPAQKHPTVFEAVNLDDQPQERQPIQKIMSAPLLFESKSVGVIQISRKGKTPTTAGADFTIRDLTALMTTAGLLAKSLKKP